MARMPDPAQLPCSQASVRNREPIRAVLAQWLTTPAHVLEVGAGTGQHAEYFAAELPWLHWQVTDREEHLPGLRARVELTARANLPPPLELDVLSPEWPGLHCDHVYTANTCHIMHWPAVAAMFAGVGQLLPAGGLFIVYGPFHHDGQPTSASNRRFDASLRAQDPGMGIRDDRALAALAADHGMNWIGDHAMPANNRILVWQREEVVERPGPPA